MSRMCPMVKVMTEGGRIIAGRVIAGDGGRVGMGELGGARTKGSKNKGPRKDKGQKRPSQKLSDYNLFVREHMKDFSDQPAKERMKSVAKLAREQGVVGQAKSAPKKKIDLGRAMKVKECKKLLGVQ